MDTSTRVPASAPAKAAATPADIAIKQFRDAANAIETEVGKVIVG